MARSLKLKTFAEVIEDEITLQHLRIHHCDDAQGYFFAKPMAAEQLFKYVARSLAHQDKNSLVA